MSGNVKSDRSRAVAIADVTEDRTAIHTPSGHTPHPIAIAETIPDLEPLTGRKFGTYRIVRELGVGGMGIVYEAVDEWLQRRVALKVLRQDLPTEQHARERFLREARAMASINHENVVPIYQVGEEGGRPFIATQLLLGETLDKRIDRDAGFPPQEIARIGREIARGLAAAHEADLVHRDVKPSNIWLEAGTGRVKILDFGLARAHDNPNLTHSGFVIGTPAFMSPEQARGEPLDGRSDLFSLGSILYLLATGERAFDGPTSLAIMRNLELHHPARVNVKRPEIPAALSNLIMELLAKNRKDRPAAASEVADRLTRPEMTHTGRLPIAPTPLELPALPPREEARATRSAPHYPADRRPPSPFSRGILYGLAAFIGFYVYWQFGWSNYGKLAIDANRDDVQIQIQRNGQIVHAGVQDRQIDLRPGKYTLYLLRPAAGYRLTQSTIEVPRGGSVTVGVEKNEKPR